GDVLVLVDTRDFLVEGLAVGVVGGDDLLHAVFFLGTRYRVGLDEFEEAAVVFADGAGFLDGFDFGEAVAHAAHDLLNAGGILAEFGGVRFLDGRDAGPGAVERGPGAGRGRGNRGRYFSLAFDGIEDFVGLFLNVADGYVDIGF